MTEEQGFSGETEATLSKKKEETRDLIRFALIALLIVIPVRFFIASPFIVSGSSMEPTFETGHYLIIDEISYRFEEPRRGEVVVFRYPEDTSKFFIKRIIGLPGETVVIRDGKVTIKNATSPDGFSLPENYIVFPSYDSGTYSVGAGEYFVMGDNREKSSDSRIWGVLPRNDITGRALLRVIPLSKFGLFPGALIQ